MIKSKAVAFIKDFHRNSHEQPRPSIAGVLYLQLQGRVRTLDSIFTFYDSTAFDKMDKMI